MKLGSLKSNSKDGEFVVISRNLENVVKASHIAPSLLWAVENWNTVSKQLESLYQNLNEGKAPGSFAYDETKFRSALPRTWLFADGSAFVHHIRLVRKARKADVPETLLSVPLMYQGESGSFHDPISDIPQIDFAHGTDFEGEIGVIVDQVEMGITPEAALNKIKLVVLINDVSLRGLIPTELAQGFGFFQSKPVKTLSPVALTIDELGSAWKDGRLHLPLDIKLNDKFFGCANAGQMHFHFGHLIAHAARTRSLAAGSLIGSGTVSNEDPQVGSSCLVEKRTIEQIETGKPITEFMKHGDTVEISMKDSSGKSLFGRIFQKVQKVEI
ncbi:MAG: fumarylacetoacetate hydrolase family protein [Pseudobdellovibrionaceae bacterium]